MGDPRHAGPRAPHRRPGEGRRARQHLLRPRQPRLHGPHPRRPRSTGSPTSLPPLEVDDPDGRGQGAGARLGLDVRPDRRRRAAGSARPATTSPRRTCATSTRSPSDLGEILKRYDAVLVPEMNLGQLSLLLRAKYLVDVVGYNHVRGLPLKAAELAEAIADLIAPRPRATDRRPAATTDEGGVAMSTTELPFPGLRRRRGVPTDGRARRPARSSPPTRRCAGAPAAATTPCSRPCRASCPTSACAARTSCSSPASAAPRGSPTTSTPTACTRSTAARRRSRPASPPRARTCRCGSSPVTATRCRSAATT